MTIHMIFSRELMSCFKPSLMDARQEIIEALIFDVFGTVVDWFGTITEELGSFARRKNIGSWYCYSLRHLPVYTGKDSEDWGAFAREWRQGYMESMYVYQGRS